MQFCFLDMDGLLVDFVQGMCEIHNRPSPYLDKSNWGKFDDIADLMGMSRTEFWAIAEEEFWANLPWTVEGKDIYALAAGLFPLEQLTILSSPSWNLGSLPGKIRWLREHIPDLSRRFIFAPNKYYIAGPGKLLIDDNDINCEMWEKAGGTAFLYPRPWNSRSHEADSGLALLTEFMGKLSVEQPEIQYRKH